MILWNRMKYLLSPQYDIYRAISKVVSGKVADIGFGTGFGMHLLAQNAEVTGYEVDKGSIDFAQSVFPYLTFKQGDIRKGIEGKFDFVIIIDVIEHIKQDKKALENVRAMLNPDGKLILSTPNRLSRYRKSSNHIREYAPKELEGILKRIFFNKVELRDYQLKPLVNQYENPIIAICSM